MITEQMGVPDPWRLLNIISSAIDAGVTSIEDLAPIEMGNWSETRFPSENAPTNLIFLDILSVLNAFETEMHNTLRPNCQVYILGLKSISLLLEESGSSHSEELAIRPALAVLHSIGLVYRLPCALKFGYSPGAFDQIRISGWGRANMNSGCKSTNSVEEVACGSIRKMMVEHDAAYRALIATCSAPTRPLDVEKIHRLNSGVPIPIVT